MEKPTNKRKEREKEARREAILDAAALVFSRKNFYEATLEEVAAEAELAKGTLYNYYKDKQDLFLSLMRRGFDMFQQNVSDALEGSGTVEAVIRRTLESALGHIMEHKYLLRVIITAGAYLPEDFHRQLILILHGELEIAGEKLAAKLATMAETKKLSETDRITAAKILFASVRQIHIGMIMGDDDRLPEQEIDNYTRILVRALTVE